MSAPVSGTATFARLARLALLAGLSFLCWNAPASAAADNPAIAKLRAGDVEALEREFSGVQASYRRGLIDDQALLAAFRVFYETDPALEPRFGSWIQNKPDSYVAHLARGIYYKYRAFEKRGNKYIRATSEEQIRGMQAEFRKALKDLSRSIELDSNPLLSYHHAMDAGKYLGEKQFTRSMLDQAAKLDPKNVAVRRKYLLTLQTRWGGSVDEMRRFAADCSKLGLPQDVLREFDAHVAQDEGWVREDREKDYAAAEAAYSRAVTLRPQWYSVWNDLSRVQVKQNKANEAVLSATKALEGKADDATALTNRGFAYAVLKQPRQARASDIPL